MKTLIENSEQAYDRLLDQWVLDASAQGIVDFWRLIDSLPGVYPAVALDSLRRLSEAGRIPPALLDLPSINVAADEKSQPDIGSQILPPQHPLAHDWRFSAPTQELFMDLILELAGRSKTIALLGTPTLYLHAAHRRFPGRFLLIDQNPNFKADLPECPPNGLIEIRDIMKEPPGHASFQVVAADPPWYLEETKAFIWAASKICKINGHILLSFPGAGTRPGIYEEWGRLEEWLPNLGLELIRIEESSLSYLTPHFERNALRAAGFDYVPPTWRKSNLVVLRRVSSATEPPPTSLPSDMEWQEVRFGDVSVWIRQDDSPQFRNPLLVPLVHGDILPTVSRRDERRKIARVWTSGNRIFGCEGCNVLRAILMSYYTDQIAQAVVAQTIGRELDGNEHQLVAKAARQVQELLGTELAETGGHTFDRE